MFEPEVSINLGQLRQGDLLVRTPKLAQALAEAHSYYAEASDYSHFLVLTQSCDLVRRGSRACKSRYITICAVRPMSVAAQREFQQYMRPIDGIVIPIGDKEKSVLAKQYLERVVNNTVDGMFFIPRGSAKTVEDHLCAFLPLSIAIRNTHYEVCLSAKVGQVKDIFAAKIGSLASNLYSRIATPDIHENNDKSAIESFMDEFFHDLGYKSVVWLSSFERSELEANVRANLEGSGQDVLPLDQSRQIIESLPKESDAIADRVVQVLINKGVISDDYALRTKAKNFLINDREYKKLTKR